MALSCVFSFNFRKALRIYIFVCLHGQHKVDDVGHITLLILLRFGSKDWRS